MSKHKQVSIELSLRAAAAVRQILFESQRGYTNDPSVVPERIFEIREVIADIDDVIEQAIEK